MTLGKRLAAIVECVEHADVAADIGCDHGYAAQALIEQGRAGKVIACDISGQSLGKAKKLACGNRMETRLGDGLAPLGAQEADAIVIAGMGGLQIIRILESEKEKAAFARQVILSPNRNAAELRRFLCRNGYKIYLERLAKENGRFYPVICARYDGAVRKEEDFYYIVGKKLLENSEPHIREYLHHEIAKLTKTMEKAAEGKHTKDYLERLHVLRGQMEEVLRCL